ncbi:uncharacterized protein LOC123292523 [Chrysoperla carnea]|uniref:uncharacterized protein LOC123292523 n=1 Tax=Chrysoperla carnea TaxID=189513 RepID=UPI001D07CAA7|nr:uncharacterized protein LOC123292523 [Chrysoperla carnea]
MSGKKFNFAKHKLQQSSLLSFVTNSNTNSASNKNQNSADSNLNKTSDIVDIDDDDDDFQPTPKDFKNRINFKQETRPSITADSFTDDGIRFKSLSQQSDKENANISIMDTSNSHNPSPIKKKFDFKKVKECIERINDNDSIPNKSKPSDTVEKHVKQNATDCPKQVASESSTSKILKSEHIEKHVRQNIIDCPKQVASESSTSKIVKSSHVESPPFKEKDLKTESKNNNLTKTLKKFDDLVKDDFIKSTRLSTKTTILSRKKPLSTKSNEKTSNDEIIHRSKFFTSTSEKNDNTSKATDNLPPLNELQTEYIQVLEKMCAIYDSIPERILEGKHRIHDKSLSPKKDDFANKSIEIISPKKDKNDLGNKSVEIISPKKDKIINDFGNNSVEIISPKSTNKKH